MRPVSPHLQVYRMPLPAYMSIFHRFTGIGLSFAIVIFLIWLFCLSFGYLDFYNIYMKTCVGQFICFLILFSGIYHFFNGLRHLFWDISWFLSMKDVYVTGYVVIALAITFTLYLWFNE